MNTLHTTNNDLRGPPHAGPQESVSLLAIISMRIVTIAIGYGLLKLAQWLNSADMLPESISKTTLLLLVMVGGAAVIAGAAAPEKIVRSIWQVIRKVIGLILIIVFPQIALWLPEQIYGQ